MQNIDLIEEIEKIIPYTHIKSIFFAAINKEDTKTIGRLLHTQHAVELSKDPEVKEFLKVDRNNESHADDTSVQLKKEVLMIVNQLEERYKDLLDNQKDQNFLKHKKI